MVPQGVHHGLQHLGVRYADVATPEGPAQAVKLRLHSVLPPKVRTIKHPLLEPVEALRAAQEEKLAALRAAHEEKAAALRELSFENVAALSALNAALAAVEAETESLRKNKDALTTDVARRGLMSSAGHRVDVAFGAIGDFVASALGLTHH